MANTVLDFPWNPTRTSAFYLTGGVGVHGFNSFDIDDEDFSEIVGGNNDVVDADSGQILQLLDNLVTNALRYGTPGTPVTISAEPEGAMVHLIVADQGEGIAPEHIKRVTERFYRVDAARSRDSGVFALGCSSTRCITGLASPTESPPMPKPARITVLSNTL